MTRSELALLLDHSVLKPESTADDIIAGAGVVRSWIAISLVLGLVLFTAFAFAVDDASLRSTLIGGLTASVGSAVAFYFSSKSADKARQDLLSATVGSELVPDLTNMTEMAAAAVLGKTSFKLEIDPTTPPVTTIDSQQPGPGTMSPKGGSITAHFRAPSGTGGDRVTG